MAAFRFLLVVLGAARLLPGGDAAAMVGGAPPSPLRRTASRSCSAVRCCVSARSRSDVEGRWPEDQPVMIVPNHISWIDILALGRAHPVLLPREKRGSRAGRSCRRSPPSRARSSSTAAAGGRSRPSIARWPPRMLDGRPVLLFAEGTTLAGTVARSLPLLAFRRRARDLLATDPAQGAVAIQPVALAYSRADAAWVGDEALVPHVWRVSAAAAADLPHSFRRADRLFSGQRSQGRGPPIP